MNSLTIKKTLTSILASICLVICLFQTPSFPEVDKTPLFENPHSHQLLEVEQYGDIQETTLNITRDKKRFAKIELNFTTK